MRGGEWERGRETVVQGISLSLAVWDSMRFCVTPRRLRDVYTAIVQSSILGAG